MVQKLIDGYCRALAWLMVISLALTAAVRGQNVEDRKKSTGRRAAR